MKRLILVPNICVSLIFLFLCFFPFRVLICEEVAFFYHRREDGWYGPGRLFLFIRVRNK